MNWSPERLTALRPVLARLFPRAEEQRALLTDSGISDWWRISFDTNADTSWFHILERANANEEVGKVLEAALGKFPGSAELKAFRDGAGKQPQGGGQGGLRGAIRLRPAPGVFIGRSGELERVIACLEAPAPLLIQGQGGLGKSTLALAALYDARAVTRFGDRRFFVDCEQCGSASSIVGELAAMAGIDPVGELRGPVLRWLEQSPAALVLDNAETPWAKEAGGFEALLEALGAVPGLGLILTLRDFQRPGELAWEELPLELLSAEDAVEVFLRGAGRDGERFRGDKRLEPLLEQLEGLPLAINLLAHQVSSGDRDLERLWARWQEERSRLLRKGRRQDRLHSLEASIELSIRAIGEEATGSEALGLLRLLGQLPAGIDGRDLKAIAPGARLKALDLLWERALARREDRRVRLLAPVREYVREAYPAAPEALEPAIGHFLALAEQGWELLGQEGAQVAARLGAELGNLEAVLGRVLEDWTRPFPSRSVTGFGRIVYALGVGNPEILARAAGIARGRRLRLDEAACLEHLGDIALQRSDLGKAGACYAQALALYESARSKLGQGNCINGLGDIALSRSNLEEAGARYAQALALFERFGEPLGQGNCILSLGDIALQRSALEEAGARYAQALALFERTGDPLGQGNCIVGLGDNALRQSNLDEASARYGQALALYERIGEPLGQGNCILGLGKVAQVQGAWAESRERFERAQRIFAEIELESDWGECVIGLGDLELLEGRPVEARAFYEQGCEAFARLEEHETLCRLHLRLALTLPASDARTAHLRTARELITTSDASPLVREYLEQAEQADAAATPGLLPVPEKLHLI